MKKVILKLKNNVKKTRKGKTKANIDIPNPKAGPRIINIRTSPKILYTAMRSLSKEQKEYVRSIGLRNLLNMKVDGAPSKIGFYAVYNFDLEKMVLSLNHGDIPVNREAVHNLLGLPLGNVDINTMPVRPNTDDTVEVWKEQFKMSNDIRPRAVQKAIARITDTGLIFKVNLFVLLCNTLGKSKSMGTCELSMLTKVTKNLDLSNIDWCSYVIDCLKETRNVWNSSSHIAYFFGLITFITLLYIENVRCDLVKVERGCPAICYWDVEATRDREQAEYETVGFGMGELQDAFVPNNTNDANETDPNAATENETAEESLATITDMYNHIVESKRILEDKIDNAMQNFLLREFPNQWKDKLKKLSNEIPREPTNDESPHVNPHLEKASQWWTDNLPEIENSIVLSTRGQTTFQHSPIKNLSYNVSPESTRFTKTSARRIFTNIPTADIQSPMPLSVIPSQEQQNIVNPKSKRQITRSNCLRSPFIERVVEINKGISRVDKNLADWIFSTQADPGDEVFRTTAGFVAQRYHMESFFPKCELFGHVIDCWSHILNFEEDLRTQLSDRRLFCNTTLTSLYLEGNQLSEEKRKSKFLENLIQCVEDYDSSLRDIRLLFLPVVRSNHIFVIIVDLRKPLFLIIDNSKAQEDDEGRYGILPEIVQQYLSDYLVSVHHPIDLAFSKVTRNRLKMPWRTDNNHTDCGIFTMRHMETFMGCMPKEFKTGFKQESDAQQVQLDKLRVKYLCKILTSTYNMHKVDIIQESVQFQAIPSRQRNDILKVAAEGIHARLNLFS